MRLLALPLLDGVIARWDLLLAAHGRRALLAAAAQALAAWANDRPLILRWRPGWPAGAGGEPPTCDGVSHVPAMGVPVIPAEWFGMERRAQLLARVLPIARQLNPGDPAGLAQCIASDSSATASTLPRPPNYDTSSPSDEREAGKRAMSGIFICYRRDDSAPWAGRVYDSLVREWGEEHVFMDVDTIAPGEDFRAVISETVSRSDVVLVVIGPDWVSVAGTSGARRLDDEGDIHRTEVVSALSSRVRVIPVLVGGAHLPEPLKDLAFRNAVVLEDRRFGSDVRALNKALVRFAAEASQGAAAAAPAPAPVTEPEPTPSPPIAEPATRPTVEANPPPNLAHAFASTATPPVPAPRAAADTAADAVAAPPAEGGDRARTWCLVAAGGGVFAGLMVGLSGLSYDGGTSYNLMLRDSGFGPGLLTSVLAGAVLAVLAALAFDPKRRLMMLSAALGVALLAGFARLREVSEILYACGYDCLPEVSVHVWYRLSGPLALVAAALCFVAVWRAGAWTRSGWASPRLVLLTLGAVALWVVTTAVDVYRVDSEPYGGAFSGYGPGVTLWAVLTAASVLALAVAAFRLFNREAGSGALIGVATFPLIAVVNELAYLAEADESPLSSGLLWIMVLPALAMIALAVFVVVQARRGPDVGGNPGLSRAA